MRKAAFVISLFFAFLPALAQDIVPDSAQAETSVPAVENAVPEAEPAESAPVQESQVAEAPAAETPAVEPPAAPAAVKVPETAPVVTDSAKPAKKLSILDALFPIEPDESIAKGHFYAGTTLSLIQANTEDDALNILIGDVYEAYGYTFTVEAFGGYFIRDAMALGVRAGYSRTWFDIDFSLMEDLMDVKERRKYVSNGFFVQPLLKNYLKVLDSRIFYLFNETSVSVALGSHILNVFRLDFVFSQKIAKIRHCSFSFRLFHTFQRCELLRKLHTLKGEVKLIHEDFIFSI